MRRLFSTVLVSAVAVLSLAACFSTADSAQSAGSVKIQPDVVNAKVAQAVLDSKNISVDVSCSDKEMTLKDGDEFECTVAAKGTMNKVKQTVATHVKDGEVTFETKD